MVGAAEGNHRDDTDGGPDGGADGCYHRDGNDDIRHRWLDAADDDSRSPSLRAALEAQHRERLARRCRQSSAESSHTITGLDLDTEYAVQVRAVFASGEGPWSPSVTPRTKSDRQIVTIEAVQPSYGEHVDQIWFLLIRDDGSGTLTVNFSFTETGADRLITRSGDGHFSREALRMTITARIKSDDSTMQPDSVITATIQPDTDYTVGTPSSASLTVTDND